jgi:hypothetical protein
MLFFEVKPPVRSREAKVLLCGTLLAASAAATPGCHIILPYDAQSSGPRVQDAGIEGDRSPPTDVGVDDAEADAGLLQDRGTSRDTDAADGGSVSCSEHLSYTGFGTYAVAVDPALARCSFVFEVSGAGGAKPRTCDTVGDDACTYAGGNGGYNMFRFKPNQTGILRLVVGGGGRFSVVRPGGGGGGASSVIFDPDTTEGPSDAFVLSIAGGGGGAGRTDRSDHGPGGHGNGDGPGGWGGHDRPVAEGGSDGIGGCAPHNQCGGNCQSVDCQGGSGGGVELADQGGFGEGAGHGGRSGHGGGGGGGYGGGAAGKYGVPGGGGAGKVFSTPPEPAMLDNLTSAATSASLGGGAEGGSSSDGRPADGEDGRISLVLECLSASISIGMS